MNRNNRALIILGLVGIFVLANWVSSSGSAGDNSNLELIISSEKESYLPGEIVFLTLTVTNRRQNTIAIFDDLAPTHGYTRFFISENNGEFKEHSHSKWGTGDSKPAQISLKSNESFSRPANILWNAKRNFDASVSPEIVKAESEHRIPYSYAFPRAGIYYVKAIYSTYIVGNKQDRRVKIISDPIKITIDEPVGEDLLVWNAVKDNGGVAYFLQEGNFYVPGYNDEQLKELEDKVEELLMRHPASSYSSPLRSQLDSYRQKVNKSKAVQ